MTSFSNSTAWVVMVAAAIADNAKRPTTGNPPLIRAIGLLIGRRTGYHPLPRLHAKNELFCLSLPFTLNPSPAAQTGLNRVQTAYTKGNSPQTPEQTGQTMGKSLSNHGQTR
jgi:hypothetical protein